MGWDEIMLQLLADLYRSVHADPDRPKPEPFPLPFSTEAKREAEVTPEERVRLTERLKRYSVFREG